ncbi:hypothetical protein B566_EDAN016269 [Ephemera danica]|nr:hypothetical protein B566_EDAN016269 [Ephemera danica]
MNTSGVERLNFGGCNSLKLLQAEDIPILPTLTHLYLGNSNLETRDLLKFADRVPTLKVLNLTGNSFIFIQNIILTSFKHLQELDMSGTNFYFEPNEKIFDTKIEILRASSTDIRCTGIYIKRYLSLVNIKCKEEALNTVLKDIIPQMKSLRYLLLSDNNITSIPPNSFQNMLPNGVVILKNNSINYTSTLNVDQLSLLDLSKNSISNLDDLKISGKIDKLNLEFNNIQKWKSRDIFSSVKHLNISNNDIRAFDRTMIKSLSTLEVVDLGNNPFDCNDCSLYDFQQWLVSQKRTQVTNLGRPYMTLQCQHPTALEGRLLIDAPYNELCTVHHRVIMGTTIPITILVIVSAILIYIYRFQLLYITQLIRVRNRAKRMRGCERKFNYDAFVSYCSADRAWVHDVLMDTLENDENKYALCLHERDFRLGAYIQDNVAEGMEQSRNVILVLSPSFVKSKWCQWELNLVQQLMFEDNPEFLILVELEKLSAKDIPSTLRLMMSTRTYLECPRAGLDMSNFWTRLKLALGKPLRITPLTSIQFTNSHNQGEEMY